MLNRVNERITKNKILETSIFMFNEIYVSIDSRLLYLFDYQVLAQLAVTGLDWCDLFVWCSNDYHLETIYLNRDLWNAVKDKVDISYFIHFL